MKGKDKVLRVTMTVDYHIIVYPDGRTNINGWTVDEVKNDWFVNHKHRSHATRDGHRIGNSEEHIGYEVVDPRDAILS